MIGSLLGPPVELQDACECLHEGGVWGSASDLGGPIRALGDFVLPHYPLHAWTQITSLVGHKWTSCPVCARTNASHDRGWGVVIENCSQIFFLPKKAKGVIGSRLGYNRHIQKHRTYDIIKTYFNHQVKHLSLTAGLV